jgi:hypothetical protein
MFAAEAGIAYTAPRQSHVGVTIGVDPDGAGICLLRETMDPSDVAAPDAGGEAVGRTVGNPQRVSLIAEFYDTHHGAEDLLLHGVKALRMIPQDDNGTLGRAGLLAHSYMLGPNGDSNGCVSIKNYDKFLRAFQNGEIKRLVVVASLNDAISASRKSVS